MQNEEKELIEGAQGELAEIKKLLSSAYRKMAKIGQINREAGRAEAGNACMRFQGALNQSLGLIQVGHADASDALLKNWPNEGGIVVLGGGGGR